MDHPRAVLRSFWDDHKARTTSMRHLLIEAELDRAQLYYRKPRLTTKEQRIIAPRLCTSPGHNQERWRKLLEQTLPVDVLDTLLQRSQHFGDTSILQAYLGQKNLLARHRRNAYYACMRAGGAAWAHRLELGLTDEEHEAASVLADLPSIPSLTVWHVCFTHYLEMTTSEQEIYLQLLHDGLTSDEVTLDWLMEVRGLLAGLTT